MTLRARRLTKEYLPGVPALRELELFVADGELFMLLGANGAGKTTAIRCFLDLVRPTAGSAEVDGIVVARDPLAAKARVSFIPDHVALYDSMSAVENLRFFARLDGSRRSRIEALRFLDRVGLACSDADRPVREFSRGMRQRLGIAIAIGRGTRNLVLDEPTAGLDPVATRSFMRLLGDLRDDGHAILMSTHDLFRLREVGDRFGVMRSGRLVTERTRAQLSTADLWSLFHNRASMPWEAA